MHKIAEMARSTSTPMMVLVEAFYGVDGPLAERGWEIRPQQKEMSMRITEQLDQIYYPGQLHPTRNEVSWGITEAPCGTGKSLAYAIPGLLLSIRQREQWLRQKEAYQKAKDVRDDAIKAGVDLDQLPPMPPAPPKEPRKFVISTANIALQEQIVGKDLPALAEMLKMTDLQICLMKGRNNYVCRWRVRSLGGELLAAQILSWLAQEGCTGDKERLPFDPAEMWGDLSVTSEECLGQSCAHWAGNDAKPCFWRESVRGYETAHVIVTNHHYLSLISNLRPGLLAVDEMHELERSLRSTKSAQLTDAAGRSLAGRLGKHLGEREAERIFAAPVRWLMEKAAQFYREEQPPAPPNIKNPIESPVTLPREWLGTKEVEIPGMVNEMFQALTMLERVAVEEYGCYWQDEMLHPPKYSSVNPEKSEEGAKLCKAIGIADAFIEKFQAVSLAIPAEDWPAADLPWAFYLDKVKTKAGGDRIIANMVPADVSWATERLSVLYPAAVFTSATIQDFGSLALALGLGTSDDPENDDIDDDAKRTGAPEPAYAIRLPSPFNLKKMGTMVVPSGPSPKDPTWEDWAACQVVDAVKIAQGGTLVLASSTKMMRKYAWALKDKYYGVTHKVRMQGEAGRSELRQWFSEDVDGVLVATRSFFQGLDVQGDACRLVIIDRVPFARPDDPVENAVQQLLVDRSGGGSGYLLRSVPEAAMVLAQGAGRLIRSQADRGAVMLLDGRVLASGEGWEMVRAALPPFPVSKDIQDIRRVLDGEPLKGVAPPPRAASMRKR